MNRRSKQEMVILNIVLQHGNLILIRLSSFEISYKKYIYTRRLIYFYTATYHFNSYADCLNKLGIKSLEYRTLKFDIVLYI